MLTATGSFIRSQGNADPDADRTSGARKGVRTPAAYRVAIKREKGAGWMPWRQEAMKDVALCDKPRGGESTL